MSIFKGLGWLFRSLWRLLNFTRLMLVNLLFLIVVLVIAFSLNQSETPDTPIEGALTLNLAGVLVEQRTQTDPTVQLLRQMEKSDDQPSEIVLSDLLWAIKSAGDDDRIKALVIKPQGLQGASLSKLQEVASAIDAFKESGKPVIAMADYYSQGAYLLAAHADHVLLNQSGAVLIEGFGVYQAYFKSALEKLNVTPHVFKVGTYKSFVEPYTRDEMSPESKEANQRWLDQLWQSYVTDVAEQREIEPDAVAPDKDHFLELLRKAGGNAASYALDNGLVDQLATRDEMTQAVIKEVGESEDHGWKGVGLKEYLAAIPEQYPQNGKDEVGLITASGAIMDGVQPAGTIGGDSLAELLAEARRDELVKAVVLRVDSPGGSAFAAEQIRAELLALKQAGKPVVISMGSYAASGGYWISADADKIFASPSTLTGSIGVFGMFATIDKALSQYGVHTDGVGTTDFVGVGLTRALPEHVGQAIQLSVEDTYQRFVGLVGKGRGLSPEEAEKAAEGRVWTGQDAKELGLVDEFGNLDDALKAAAELANLKSWQVTPIAPEESARDRFLRELFDSSAQALAPHLQSWLPAGLGKALVEMNRSLDPLTRFNDPQGTYAFCPVCVP
ncbi:signal peptide peptidase SppA [Aeromonas rivipollensis]|uniref:signal peptide peptidase SppA n=1 Tax=Aeromonas rivipollensis TaxID=948519 RepID=UPI0027D95090|nr:signal peptide peptidase SppA [uncultured Aeromonas sp.]MDU1142950.1 signal peptide peptidase SppA [Aeromonas hydrophila]